MAEVTERAALSAAAPGTEIDLDKINRDFATVGARRPWISWAPQKEDLTDPLIQQFASICAQHAGSDGTLRIETVKLAWFASLKDWIMVLNVDRETDILQYAYYGAGIADSYGEDMTGRKTTDFKGYVGAFFTAIYREMIRTRVSVFSEHEPPAQVFVRSWRRYAVPVLDANDNVVQIIAINMPQNDLRAGLEIITDPVLLLDKNQVVHFTNTAADKKFNLDRGGNGTRSLNDLTGIALTTTHSPEEMIGRRIVQNEVLLDMTQGLVDDYQVSISATTYRKRSFYVLVFRNMADQLNPTP
ncbi:MAG: hypothetical protein AAF848_03245 [Pseudomonadota bacterium]